MYARTLCATCGGMIISLILMTLRTGIALTAILLLLLLCCVQGFVV
jgi:uncharacterized membrane protein